MEHTAVSATPGTYRKHLDAGETPCQPCKDAEAAYKRQRAQDRRAQAAADFAEALDSEPEVEDDLDELSELRENLRVVRAAMRNAKGAREIASLSKQRQELTTAIVAIQQNAETGKQVTGLDELRNKRKSKLARVAGE